MTSLEEHYTELREHTLLPLAERLESYIKTCLGDTPRVDRVGARAKRVDRFLEKAWRAKNGTPKYSDPLNQIQDQVGARVVMFYLADVVTASRVVEKYFRPIESQQIVPDSENAFGYFGAHYILLIPTDVYGDGQFSQRVGPRFFELQIKTLFQHAWAEAEHDLGYKPMTPLTRDQRRKVAFTSAQAWGADMIFDELHRAVEE